MLETLKSKNPQRHKLTIQKDRKHSPNFLATNTPQSPALHTCEPQSAHQKQTKPK